MLKRIFISGLTAIIPLVITIYVIVALFNFADGILGKSVNAFLQRNLSYTIPGIGIVIALFLIVIVGVLVEISRMKLFRWFAKWFEQLFFNIPLVNKIYTPVSQIVNFLFFPPRKNFKSTVLVEYPRKGIFAIGLLTNENSIEFPEKKDKKYYSVFIPSSPSPVTGFTIIIEEKELIFLDIGVDEALKLVVSGGLLNPQ
ncbi:MAG: DUF502 domain-containing protein [Candidatus Omnitrophica bacterium]|nr:DUF502 domain-containing protein [Candidatus Omnitrophota bacterium]